MPAPTSDLPESDGDGGLREVSVVPRQRGADGYGGGDEAQCQQTRQNIDTPQALQFVPAKV